VEFNNSNNSSPAPGRIWRLPPLLANQIAAGEVVERPASVVKELVENALDAGAMRISVEVRRGGLELIRVTDDGHGIHPDDLRLALDRHATSKIRNAGDLAAIRSLGFRGEALPSIASVARLKIVSRIAAEAAGREVESCPGEPDSEIRPAAHPVGTTVEVGALFHQVPARRRFLRAEQTEYLHVLDIARRLALSRAGLALGLVHDGRRVLNAPADGEPRRRLQQILGRSLEAAAREIEYAAAGMRLSGWLCAPEFHRSQSELQFLFLNGRVMRDRQLSHAVRAAYSDRIPPGRYPAYVLSLELDPAAADVNVHPTKHEVRFRHARDVHDFVQSCLNDALGTGKTGAGVAESAGAWSAAGAPVPEPASHRQSWRPGAIPPGAPAPQQLETMPCLLVAGRYLIADREGVVWLADGLALCRVWFRRQLAEELRGGEIRRRPLLVPVQVPATEVEAERVASRADQIAHSGFLLQRVAPTEIMVREFPAVLADCALLPLVRALLPVWAATIPAARDAMLDAVAAALPESTPGDVGQSALMNMLVALAALPPGVPGLWRTLEPRELDRLLRGARPGG
jgi:DNA mismatch repair protein MutL